MAGKFAAIGIQNLDLDVRGAVVRGVDCGVDCTCLISICTTICLSN
jgi:hypothetical protein